MIAVPALIAPNLMVLHSGSAPMDWSILAMGGFMVFLFWLVSLVK